ncbi:MAG TPA: carboxypeptidase-like regulatory domain-containing protein, partial [Planctomycetota bacterium]|nr:carboxypeptidase-like regulatory domain-containing protein [Planctomycetota bacterium]
ERARSATTDAAGRYEFPHAWAASGRVQLVQPDWRHVGIDVPAWGEGSSVDAPDLVAVRGGVLAGIVRDDQGTPIAGAVVAPTSGFLDERSPDEDILAWLWLHDRESAALVRTDERGEFRIPGLGDETWRLFAGAPGFEPAGSAPARPGAPAMDFRLHPERPLLLRVVDGAGRRVPGAEASACWEAGHGGRGVLAVEAAPESSFLVHPQGAPLVAITVTAPGFAARQFLVQPARLASPELGVTLSAEARVDGRLVDDRGELVPDAWLEFLPARTDTPSGDGLPGRDVPGVGDDSSSRGAGRVVRVSGGRFSAGGLSAGAWTVDVAAAGLLPGPPTRLTLTEAQHLQDLLIRVPRCGEIRGQVHRADGTPVRAAPALLEGWITLTAVGAADGDDRQTVLGEDGSFLFGQLPAGSYVVDSGLGATTSVDVPAGGSVQVDLLVPRWPMVRGLVLDGDRPVAGAAIDPDPRGDGVQDVHVEGAVSDEHGRFTLVVHGTGTFALRAGTAAGGLSDEVVLDLQADRESTAELRLLPGRIDGLVTDADTGAPISGAHVALSAEASAWSDTTTDERGHFSIAGVQAGEHRVFASAAGWCADATAPLQLAGKGALTDVSLALRRGATVEVTVLGSHAEPVETVDVALWGSDPRSPGEIVVYRQGTSSAGEATFTDLGAGDMRIGILESGTWFFSWDPEEIAQAALDTMSLALEPGATRRVVLHLPTTH